MRWQTSFVCILVLVMSAGAGNDDANNKFLAKLQGEWQVVKALENGRPVPEDKAKASTLSFGKDKVIAREAEKHTEEAMYRIDASKDPVQIDIAAKKEGTIRGIIRIEGDTLKICYSRKEAGERPTEFVSTQGSSFSLIELKRVK